MSRFNVTLAVAAVCGSMILEGCKSDATKTATKTYEKFTKNMDEVAKKDHKEEDCDKVNTDYVAQAKADAEKFAEKAKKNADKDAKKAAEKMQKANKKAAGDDDYKKYLEACKTSTGKDEVTVECQICITAAIPEDKRPKQSDLESKKEQKEEIKFAEAQLKYVQSYASCYISASDYKATDFDAAADNTLIKTYPTTSYEYKVEDKKVTVTRVKADSNTD